VPDGNATVFLSPSTVSILIVELPANSAPERRYFLKARLGNKKNFGRFSPNVNVDLDGNISWNPDPGGSSSDVLNIKQALLNIDFGFIVTPNNGYWLWRTMTNINFGPIDYYLGFPDGLGVNPYQLDLGLLSVVENPVTAGTDIETFVWQVDPT